MPKRQRVDERLRVFDAKADRKRFGLDIDAAFVQLLEGIARAVADGQDDMVRRNVFAAGEDHAA